MTLDINVPPVLKPSDYLITDQGCWEWQGCKNPKGYGRFGRHKPYRMKHGLGDKAHRVVYQLLVRPLATDEQLDHLCRNPSCVNPDHLEPGELDRRNSGQS